MISVFGKVKVVCVLVVMGFWLVAHSAAPTVTSVTAQQRYPWNGLVDIAVTFNGEQGDVAKANCAFAATDSATKTALAIAHVIQQGDDTGSGTTWTRRFIWDANADLGEVKIDDIELGVDVGAMGGVQLWAGGPYWAECNVGASKPEEYGLYFSWGDTAGHEVGWAFDADNCLTHDKSDSELRSMGYIDSSGNLTLAHDAARAHLGAPWRMPTDAEFGALIGCTRTWMTRNGVSGLIVTGKDAYASKSIFLPAIDQRFYPKSYDGYWSSTSSRDFYGAVCYNFGSDYFYRDWYWRHTGQSVRPVRGFVASCKTHLVLDNRKGTRVAEVTERICFSPTWETDAAGATAVVSVNDEVVKSATEAGVFEWVPTQNGTNWLAHAVFVDGVQVGETLTATFFVKGLAVEPRSVDWSKGCVEIGWTESAVSSQVDQTVTYDVYWSCKSNGTDHVVREKTTALSCRDDNYLDHGEDDDGICPIYYTVVGSNGRMGCCLTRRRYALSVGYTTLEPPASMSVPNANAFWNLFTNSGGVVDPGDAVCQIDSDATNAKIKERLDWVADMVQPGDIFAFFVTTHGRASFGSDTDFEGITTYPEGSYYAIGDLKKGFDEIGKKDALVISILDVCGSGQMANSSKDATNTAWITAATGSQSGYLAQSGSVYYGWEHSYFGLAFLDWGWRDGYAGHSGAATFYELARYAYQNVKGHAFDNLQKPNIYNGDLVKNVRAYSGVVKVAKSRPSAPAKVSVVGSLNSLAVAWSEVMGADYYIVKWREEGSDESFEKLWFRVDGQGLVLPNSNNTAFAPIPGKRYEFCVCAVNAAGESEMSPVAIGGIECVSSEILKPWLDQVKRVVELQFSRQMGSSVSAFQLALGDDGTVRVEGATSDGVEFETTSRIASIEDGVTSIPLYCPIGETGDAFSMVVKMSSSGMVSLEDGACWTDGETREDIELIVPFELTIDQEGCVTGYTGDVLPEGDLVIPEGVRQINGYALSWLPIRSVHIPESCEWIGEGAFLGCENLTAVTGGAGVEYVATRAFEGTLFMEDGEGEPEVAYVGRCAVGLRRSWMLEEMYFESNPDEWAYELRFRDDTVCVAGFDCLPITSIVFPDSVEMITYNAFYKDDLLTSVVFGRNLRRIEFGAFETWDSPYDIWDTPEETGRTPAIMELYFPAGFEYIGSDAFSGWSNLQTAYFEGRIDDWWSDAFPEGCELVSLTIQKLVVEDGVVKGLVDVVDKTGQDSGDIVDGALIIPDGVTAIDDFALSDAPIRSIVIPESCKRIGAYALAWCYDLEQVIGGDGVESVGYWAFGGSRLLDDWADEFGLVYVGKCLVGCRGRTALQTEFDAFEGDVWKRDLIIKDGVTSVGGLENLPFTSVTLPDSVVSIDNYAFECSSGWGWDDEANYGVLERVELGKGLRTIGDLAFYGCRRLGVVSGGDAVERVGYYSFGNTGILPVDDDGAFEVVYIGKIAIGCRGKFPQGTPDDECCLVVREGTMMIAESAFSECADIRAVSLPDSLKTVPAEAFSHCTNLKKISLGNGVEVIEDSAFANTALSKIDLPSNVLFVGAYAFGAYDDDFGMPEECELKPTLEEVVFHSDQIVFDSSAFLCRTTTFDTDAEMEFVEPEVAFSVGVLRSVRMELEGFELRGWRRKAADGADRAGNGNFGVDELSEVFGIEGEWVWDDVTGWDDYVPYWVAPCVCPVGSPVVVGDDTARVTGDKERGFTIVPNEGVEDVVISVPSEVSAEKVVVELSPDVRSVVPNGVTIKIMRDAYDITSYLNIPPHDGLGRIDLTVATVKEEIVKETLDPSKDAVIELNAANPRLITTPTRKGLFYQFREGVTVEEMANGDSTIGDGKPWSPEIKIKGGNSAFYSISVGKGE